jgi:hypothetical protein
MAGANCWILPAGMIPTSGASTAVKYSKTANRKIVRRWLTKKFMMQAKF